jgi:predicted nucleic acid-binding protein
MGQQYLIDSNTVIDYLSGKLPQNGMLFLDQLINNIPNISVITKIEVLGYKTTLEASLLLNGFVDDSAVYALSDEIVKKTIEIRKEHKIKIPDAIIAATAMTNGLVLVSRNTKDFRIINGLEVSNPNDL